MRPEENPKDAGEVDQDGPVAVKTENEVINRGGTFPSGTSVNVTFFILKICVQEG